MKYIKNKLKQKLEKYSRCLITWAEPLLNRMMNFKFHKKDNKMLSYVWTFIKYACEVWNVSTRLWNEVLQETL